ncbi:MAG: hypothetical protein HPY58_08220 [Firmicutes bacterium]|nr:hypothetical protein [Bacillota bacterium]
MCECCTPKEHLGHLHLHGVREKGWDHLNEAVQGLPGVFRAVPADHGDAEAVILFDRRVISEERLKNTLNEKGFRVS